MLEKEYRTYLKLEKGLSPNSVDAYLMDYQRLKEYADKHGIDVVHASFDDLQAFVFDTFKEIASVRTQARLVAGIHSFYRFLLYHNYIEQDPSELIETPKKEMHLPDVLSVEEIDRMIAQIDMSKSESHRNRAIIEMLYGSGLRVSELVNLEINPEAVDPDDVEMLQDMILAAVNEAMRIADAEAANNMSRLTGGMNLGGLF
jgi:integrase/recombinase XerD